MCAKGVTCAMRAALALHVRPGLFCRNTFMHATHARKYSAQPVHARCGMHVTPLLATRAPSVNDATCNVKDMLYV